MAVRVVLALTMATNSRFAFQMLRHPPAFLDLRALTHACDTRRRKEEEAEEEEEEATASPRLKIICRIAAKHSQHA
jgi:hypothetical protein